MYFSASHDQSFLHQLLVDEAHDTWMACYTANVNIMVFKLTNLKKNLFSKEIMVGSQYQAEIPALVCYYDANEKGQCM